MGAGGLAGAAAVAAGVAASVQIAVLGRLGDRIGALEAGAVAFALTAVGGVVVLLVAGRGLSAYADAFRQPWWMWAGGLTGVLIVLSVIYAGPRLGVVATTALLLAGQFAAAAAIDRFGWFGVERFALGWERWLGLGLVIVGAMLTLRR